MIAAFKRQGTVMSSGDNGGAGASSMGDAQPPEHPADRALLPFHVVAIGASAGGVEALIRFFSHMSADSGCAFVVVMHLAPERESLLATLIGRATPMRVEQVQRETAMEPNQVYVAPPGHYVELAQGRLQLRPIEERAAFARPSAIDHLMISLAEDQREQAIAIVLTGTDSDGSLGIKAIKSEGGLVIAQSPGQAAHPGMPMAALATGVVDCQLPIEEMPRAILDFVGTAPIGEAAEATAEAQAAAPPQGGLLQQILELVRAQLGLDFRGYKTPMLLRRVRRRMALARITETRHYLDYLQQTPAETKALSEEFLISVTEFFREPETWDVLAQEVVPQVIGEKAFGAPVRIWVPACATGEEAYSIAMLFLEQPRLADRALKLQVFATDLDRTALEVARKGRYPRSIEHAVSQQRLERFFLKSGTAYQVRKELREAVMFAPQNLTNDPPFSHMDLVSCRNLLIYLVPELQRRLLEVFHFALEPNGLLVLGKSETANSMSPMFAPVTQRARVYRRIGPARPAAIRLPPMPGLRHDVGARAPSSSAHEPDYGRMVREALIDQQIAAAVLINREGQALYFYGQIHTYLQHPEGAPITDLFAMLRDDLRPQLRAAVHKASGSHERAETVVPMNGHDGSAEQLVRMTVTPLGARGDAELFLVSFESLAREPAGLPATDGDSAALNALENELRNTKRDLRAAIEELESTNEELKVANEEAMSMNEELQSANEELETSKEELQSVNEELTTVNNQLQEKVNELEAVNDDLSNLLTSTHIPTLFLDRQLNIKRYTPAVTKLFRLIPGDVNRPLSDIASQIDLASLFADARRVLEQLAPVEQETSTASGEHYLRRVLPYRTQEDRIDGVVVTFIDITEIRRSAEGQRRFAAVMQASNDAIVVHDLAGRVLAWNRGAEALYGHPEADVLNVDLSTLLPPQAREQHAQCLQRLLAGERIVGVDTRRRHRDGTLLDVSASYSLVGDGGKPGAVALIERDVTQQKRAEHELRDSEQRFRTLADSAPVLIWMANADGSIEFVNREFCHYTGLGADALIGRRWTDLLHPEDVGTVGNKLKGARGSEGRIVSTAQLRAANGEYRWMKLSVMQRVDARGEAAGWVGSMADIDAQVGAERALRAADRRKDEFLAMLGHELRNPLVPIRNAAEVLNRVASDDSRVRWVRDTLVRQVEHVTRLVDDLLNISLVTRGAMRLQLEPVELSHPVERAIEAVQPLIKRKRHRFEWTRPDEPLWVEGDNIRLTQVFENLLTNAAKYTDDGGTLSLRLERDGEQALVHVLDNGLGIAPGMQARIFDLFVQDERSIDRSQGGLGIGLALVRHLVQMHHGEVHAHSEGIGKGCEFVVRLPLLLAAAAPAPVEHHVPTDGHGGRVLLVDDDADSADSTAMLLRMVGHEVETAGNLEDALQVARRWRPQVVLLDLALPHNDGYEVAQRLRALPEMSRDAAYIAISGFGQPEDFQRTRDAGFVKLMVKPVDPDELDRLIASLLRQKT
jgi:two-component system CheB/CheR fusion protein